MLKDYLSAKDMNDLLFISHLLETNFNTLENWKQHENITKEEAKYLKTAITYTEKFLSQVFKRMPEKENEKFIKRCVKAENEPVRILDKWMHDRILGKFETEHEVVKIERPQLEKLALACIQSHCEDCTESYNSCDIYDIMEDNLIPRCEHLKNCPYAYWSAETINKMQKAVAKRKAEQEEKKSKGRKAKKNKNRFDEDDEIFEYKLERKGGKSSVKNNSEKKIG